MIKEGYAAATSRRVAAEAGLKPQLIYYYFGTMDDLLVEVLGTIIEKLLSDYTRCLTSRTPLRALWDLSRNFESTILTAEFMALANHRKAIGEELARFGNQLRAVQEEFFSLLLERHNIDEEVIPPETLSLIMLSLAQSLGVESNWGLTRGHAKTLAFIEKIIEKYELPADK